MSAETQADDSSEVQVNKTVTIVGYLPEEYGSWREWADDTRDDDYFETEPLEDNTYHMEYGDEEDVITESKFNKLREMDTGDINLRVESEIVDEHKLSYRVPTKEISKSIFEEIIEENEMDWVALNKTWREGKRIEGDDKVINSYPRVDEIPMLKPMDEMTVEEPFVEGTDPRPVLKFKFRIFNVNEEEADEISEEFVAPFMKKLGRNDDIERVRMLDCVEKKEEQGACLNI